MPSQTDRNHALRIAELEGQAHEANGALANLTEKVAGLELRMADMQRKMEEMAAPPAVMPPAGEIVAGGSLRSGTGGVMFVEDSTQQPSAISPNAPAFPTYDE